jgi:hypothetical protein
MNHLQTNHKTTSTLSRRFLLLPGLILIFLGSLLLTSCYSDNFQKFNEVPQLVNPQDHAVFHPIGHHAFNLTFEWTPVEHATSYTLLIDGYTVGTVSAPITTFTNEEAIIDALTQSPTTEHTWQIEAQNFYLLRSSEIYHFEVQVDATPPTIPTSSHATGVYCEPISLDLQSSDDFCDPVIYYTVDGSTPTQNSTVFSDSININDDATIQAIAIDWIGNQSAIASWNYNYSSLQPTTIFPEDICEGNPTSQLGVSWENFAGVDYRVAFWNGSAWQEPDDVQTNSAYMTAPSPGMDYQWRLQAYTDTCIGDWITSPLFDVIALPVSPLPDSVTDVCEGTPSNLTWVGSSGITYEIYYDSDSLADTTGATLVESVTYPDTTLSIPPVLAPGIYYWKILARNQACVGSVSVSTSAFEVIRVTNPPDVTPAGSVCLGNTVDVSWTTVSGHNYDIYYDTDNAIDTTGATLVETVSAPSDTLTTPPALPGGTYYWKIQASHTGCIGDVMVSATSFDVYDVQDATNIVPDGTVCEGTGVNLSWTTLAGHDYDVYYDTDNSTDTIGATFVETVTAPDSQLSSAPLISDGTYYWKVVSHIGSCMGNVSVSATSFDVIGVTDASNIIPDGNACVGTSVNLTWDTIASHDYDVYYDTDPTTDTTGATWVETVSAPSNTLAAPPTPPTGTYYWKVISSTGGCSGAVVVSSTAFTISTAIDATNILPDGDSCDGETANVSWTTSAGHQYDVYYDTDNATDTTGAVWVETVSAPDNVLSTPPTMSVGTYYWKVVGSIGSCTANVAVSASSFSVTDVTDASGVTPDGNVCEGAGTNLAWTSTASHTYEIYYDTDNNTDTVGATYVDSVAAPQNTLAAPVVVPVGTYYWKVVSIQNGCVGSVVSAAATFDVIEVTEASNITPDGNVCVGNTANLTWTTTASHTYDIYYDTDNATDTTGATFVETISAPSNTLSTPPTPASGTYYWKIIVSHGGCTGTISVSPTSFSVASVTDASNVTPDGDVCAGSAVNLTWTTAVGHSYDVYYDTDNAADTTGATLVETVSAPSNTLSTSPTPPAGNYYWKVVATIGSCTGSVVVSSASFDIIGVTDASNVVASGDECVGSAVNLTWTTTASHSYDIYYDTDSAADTTGATLVETVSAPSNTLSTPPTPPAGTYYWKVVAEIGTCTGVVISSASSFHVIEATDASSVVPDGDICLGDTANLTWVSSAGHDYDVYYDTDNLADTTGATLVQTISAPGNTLSSPPSPGTGTYYWKIVSKSGTCLGNVVPSASSFDVFTPTDAGSITPDGDACDGDTANVSWTTVSGHSYDVYYDTDNATDTSGATFVETVIEPNDTLSSPPTPAVGTYYWKIITTANGCVGNVGVSGSAFSIISVTDATNLVPDGDVCNGALANLTWTSTAGHTYDVYYDTDSAADLTGATFVETISAPENSLSSPPTPGIGTYYWKIVSNYNGCMGNVSVSTLSFDVTASTTVDPQIEVAGSGICSGASMIFSWLSTEGVSYTVQYKLNSGGSWTDTPGSPCTGCNSEILSLPDETYDYQIITTDTCGSTPFAATGVTPFVVGGTAPSDPGLTVGDICDGGTANFSWTSTVGESYSVQYGPASGTIWMDADNVGCSGCNSDTANPAMGLYNSRVIVDTGSCVAALPGNDFNVRSYPSDPSLTDEPNFNGTSFTGSWEWGMIVGYTYDLEWALSTNLTGTPTVSDVSSPYDPASDPGTGLWDWAVRACNDTCCSNWSTDSFLVAVCPADPVLTPEPDDCTNGPFGGTLEWTTVGSLTYDIEISDSGPLTGTPTATNVTPPYDPSPNPAGAINWAIRAYNGTCYSNWVVDSFGKAGTPSDPNITAAEDTCSPTFNQEFEWLTAVGVTYEIEWATSGSLSGTPLFVDVSEPYDPPDLAVGTWDWALRACKGGCCSDWSVDTFDVTGTVVDPVLVEEPDFCGVSFTDTLNWSTSGGMTYDFEHALSGLLLGTPDDTDVSPPYSPSPNPATGTHDWAVRACDGTCCGNWIVDTFTVGQNPAPNPITGLANLTGGSVPYTDTLSWNKTNPDFGYDVALYNNACGGMLVSGWPKTVSSGTSSISTGSISTAGTYYWSVRSSSLGACSTGSWSACKSFTVIP